MKAQQRPCTRVTALVHRFVCLRARLTQHQVRARVRLLTIAKAARVKVREPCVATTAWKWKGRVSDCSPARVAPSAADLSQEPRRAAHERTHVPLKCHLPSAESGHQLGRDIGGWWSGGPVLLQRSDSGSPSTPLRTRCSSAGRPAPLDLGLSSSAHNDLRATNKLLFFRVEMTS